MGCRTLVVVVMHGSTETVEVLPAAGRLDSAPHRLCTNPHHFQRHGRGGCGNGADDFPPVVEAELAAQKGAGLDDAPGDSGVVPLKGAGRPGRVEGLRRDETGRAERLQTRLAGLGTVPDWNSTPGQTGRLAEAAVPTRDVDGRLPRLTPAQPLHALRFLHYPHADVGCGCRGRIMQPRMCSPHTLFDFETLRASNFRGNEEVVKEDRQRFRVDRSSSSIPVSMANSDAKLTVLTLTVRMTMIRPIHMVITSAGNAGNGFYRNRIVEKDSLCKSIISESGNHLSRLILAPPSHFSENK